MDAEKLVLSEANPSVIAFPPEQPRARININGFCFGAKAMPNELSQKSPPSVVDKFKALLKQRDDDLRVSAEDKVSLPRTEEIVQLYELVLSELSFNSKPIITDLTIVAGDQKEHCKGIADAICARILEVCFWSLRVLFFLLFVITGELAWFVLHLGFIVFEFLLDV